MADVIQLGLNCKLYYGAVGATPNTLLTNVKDVSVNVTSGEADATTRAAGGWRISVSTLFEGELTFEMNKLPSDTGYKAIRTAFITKAPIAMAALDSVGDGLDADWVITNFSENQGLEEAVTISVTAKPTLVSRAPAFIEGTGASSSSSSGA